MIPILYDKTETEFKSNGLGLLVDTSSCYVEEERNELYELTLSYPVDSFLYDSIEPNCYIKAKANNKYEPQIFRIYYVSKPLGGQITVKAEHISYELKDDFIESVSVNGTCKQALNSIKSKSLFSNKFNFNSNITGSKNFSAGLCSAWECIKGESGSIIDTYGNGADIIRNNFNISVIQNAGDSNNILISYGKNITGFTCEENWTNVCTRIYPYAEKDDTIYSLPEKYVDSPYIGRDKHPRVKAVDLSEKFGDDEEISIGRLRNFASKYFSETKCDIPELNYNVNFIDLSKTEEYKNLGFDENVNIFDNVIIRHPKYNIDTKVRILKVRYNVLLEKYDNIELNFKKNTITSTINNTVKKVNEVSKTVDSTKKGISVKFGEIDNMFQACVTDDEFGSKIEASTDHVLVSVNDAKGDTGLNISRDNGVEIFDAKFIIYSSSNRTKKVFWVDASGNLRGNSDSYLEMGDTTLQSNELTFNSSGNTVSISAYRDGINFDCPIYVNHTKIT